MVAMMQSIVLLLVGFVLLIKGADFFVEGSSSVARALRIPSMIVGLTIVAMGTSLPELAVSVTASVAGNNALAVSNVIGSNLFNLMFVCGASVRPYLPKRWQKSFPLRQQVSAGTARFILQSIPE